MATGGYQTPGIDEPTGFGSDSVEGPNERTAGFTGGNAPLFGIDYKRLAALRGVCCSLARYRGLGTDIL